MKKLCLALLLTAFVAGCGKAAIAPAADPAAKASATAKQDTSLQRHVRYFDRNGDGIIKFKESVQGIEALGLGAVAARLFATGVHGALGPKTSGRVTSDIRIANIHVGVHPGSVNFKQDGHFRPESFARMFEEFDLNRSGSLSKSEIQAMLRAKKKTAVSYHLSRTAFTVLVAVAGDTQEAKGRDSDKALSRKRLEAFYDGSLFYQIAAERGKQRDAVPVDVSDVDLTPTPEAASVPME